MLEIVPNFNFNGCCEEAINTYIKAFGARLNCLLRYSDADPRDWTCPSDTNVKDRIYHAEIAIGNMRMIMCDRIDMTMTPGLMLSLVVMLDGKDDVLKAYDALKDGCEIIQPVHSTTYSACEVVLVVRFGVRWGIMTESV